MAAWSNKPSWRSVQRNQAHFRESDDDDVIFLGRVENNKRRKNSPTPDEMPSVSHRRGAPGPDGFEVTYYRPADTVNYPHSRSDCWHHLFSIVYETFRGPYQENASHCDKCYCYVCDKPAKECRDWRSVPAHCNAHSKSSFWRSSRARMKTSSTKSGFKKRCHKRWSAQVAW